MPAAIEEMSDQPVVPKAYWAAELTPTMMDCWLGLRGSSPRAKEGATLQAACRIPTRTAGSVVKRLNALPMLLLAAAMNLAMGAIMPVIRPTHTLLRNLWSARRLADDLAAMPSCRLIQPVPTHSSLPHSSMMRGERSDSESELGGGLVSVNFVSYRLTVPLAPRTSGCRYA